MLSASWYVGNTTSVRIPEAYDPAVAGEGIPTVPDEPTALPGAGARAVAFVAIIVAGLCGLLIGRAFVALQCHGDCDVQEGLGGLTGAVVAAGGVAVVCVLVLRAMNEWRSGITGPGRDRS